MLFDRFSAAGYAGNGVMSDGTQRALSPTKRSFLKCTGLERCLPLAVTIGKPSGNCFNAPLNSIARYRIAADGTHPKGFPRRRVLQ